MNIKQLIKTDIKVLTAQEAFMIKGGESNTPPGKPPRPTGGGTTTTSPN
jgi:hypothetical protein